MYYADSDLLTIVLYVIVMAAGIYSSFKKESKHGKSVKRKGSQEPQELQEPQETAGNRVAADDDDLFSFAIDKIFAEPEDAVMEPDGNEFVEDVAVEDKSVEEGYEEVENLASEGEMVVEPAVKPATESCIMPALEADEESVPESDDLKRMLKNSPKNIILASEILTPKYKEY